nr:MAG TPA: hypothetical protein [Caudoviricetes sp.]
MNLTINNIISLVKGHLTSNQKYTLRSDTTPIRNYLSTERRKYNTHSHSRNCCVFYQYLEQFFDKWR